jgi:hypothetical protein
VSNRPQRSADKTGNVRDRTLAGPQSSDSIDTLDRLVVLIVKMLIGAAVAWAVANGTAGYWTPPVVLVLLIPRRNAELWATSLTAWLWKRETDSGADP